MLKLQFSVDRISLRFDFQWLETLDVSAFLHLGGRGFVVFGWLSGFVVIERQVVSLLRQGLVVEGLVDIKISFGDPDDSFDHGFACIDKIRLLDRLVLLESLIDNDWQLSAAENDLGALLLLFELLEKGDEIINHLLAFISRLDSIDDVLEEILVFLTWCDWLDSSNLETFLEKTCINASAATENTASFGRFGKKNVFQDLV